MPPIQQPPALHPYYTQPPTAQHAPYPPGPNQAYSNVPPSSQNPGVPPGAPPAAGFPPNLLALIQSAQQQKPPQLPGAPQYSMPPPLGNGQPLPTPGTNASGNPQFQQLMSFLVSC